MCNVVDSRCVCGPQKALGIFKLLEEKELLYLKSSHTRERVQKLHDQFQVYCVCQVL